MARLNRPRPSARTHEGAPAKNINPLQQLRRSVLSCMLFEREFYEDGISIAQRIDSLVPLCLPDDLLALTSEARNEMNLRHAPLLLAASMCKHFRQCPEPSAAVEIAIQRADELAEILAIACAINGVGPDKVKSVLGAQMKKGLARAFQKFSEYHLAKYDRRGAIRLRDVLFLCHAKPKDTEQAAVWKGLIDGTLSPPDTWEVGLSTGGDKRMTFERLLSEQKLGYMALLRNLRNMQDAGVRPDLVREAIRARRGADRVLPFRYVAAATHAPQFAPDLDAALRQSMNEVERFDGETIILVDVSYSMACPLSKRSDMTRLLAAASLACVFPGPRRVFSFSDSMVEVPPYDGLGGINPIANSQPRSGTYLGAAVREINGLPHDRLIVITDEQSHDRVPDPVCGRPYMINVASARNGVGYHRWIHLDGFSESVLRWIAEFEATEAA